jgi:excisionase family DNA binding protein
MTYTLQREYATVTEAAALWRVAPKTVYRMIKQGRVPHVRVGGDGPIRIPVEALDSADRSFRRPESAPTPAGRAVEVGAAHGEEAA